MISIIVPVYNSEKNLRACVESLINQTEKEIEILLIEDGSKDSSPFICDEYARKDARIRSIHKENEGVSMARNRGIEEARGEYLQFVDSDDTIESDMCEKMLSALKAEDADLVLCGFHHCYLGRDIVKVPGQGGSYLLTEFSEEFLRLYQGGFLNMPWNKLFRKALVKERFDKNLSLGEDLLFNLAYMKDISKIAVVAEPLYYYIQERNQNTLSTKRRDDKLQIAEKICRETKRYYAGLKAVGLKAVGLKEAGLKDTGLKDAETEKARSIIDARYVIEFLDEIEGLAFDKSMNRKEKKELIVRYMTDPYLCEVNHELNLQLLDYKVINWFLKKKQKNIIYLLVMLRKAVVILSGKN